MNKSPNKSLIAECDRLVQEIACLGTCAIWGHRRAECGHHLIKKSSSKYFQHDLRNIVPLLNHHHIGDSPTCAELRPAEFKHWMYVCRPEQHDWWQTHRNERHKAPNREALLKTRDYLRAFLEAGEPFVWANRLKQEN